MSILDSSLSFHQGTITNNRFNFNNDPPLVFNTSESNLTSQKIFPFPTGSKLSGFLLLGDGGQLYNVSGYFENDFSITKITGGAKQPLGILTANLGLNSDNSLTFFAVDNQHQNLWILREASTGSTDFDPWVNLGNNVNVITAPQNMSQGAEVYMFTLQGNVKHLHQTSDTKIWYDQLIKGPTEISSVPVESPTHVQEIGVKNAQGISLANTICHVTCDRKITANINGLTYTLDKNMQATVITDAHGMLRIASLQRPLVLQK